MLDVEVSFSINSQIYFDLLTISYLVPIVCIPQIKGNYTIKYKSIMVD